MAKVTMAGHRPSCSVFGFPVRAPFSGDPMGCHRSRVACVGPSGACRPGGSEGRHFVTGASSPPACGAACAHVKRAAWLQIPVSHWRVAGQTALARARALYHRRRRGVVALRLPAAHLSGPRPRLPERGTWRRRRPSTSSCAAWSRPAMGRSSLLRGLPAGGARAQSVPFPLPPFLPPGAAQLGPAHLLFLFLSSVSLPLPGRAAQRRPAQDCGVGIHWGPGLRTPYPRSNFPCGGSPKIEHELRHQWQQPPQQQPPQQQWQKPQQRPPPFAVAAQGAAAAVPTPRRVATATTGGGAAMEPWRAPHRPLGNTGQHVSAACGAPCMIRRRLGVVYTYAHTLSRGKYMCMCP